MQSQLPGYVTKTTNMTGWLLVLALIGAAAFVVVRYVPHSFEIASREPEVPAPTVHFPTGNSDDVARHLQDAAGAQADAAAALRESQDWLGRALPYLDDDRVAMRRLYLARTAQNSAAFSLARSREELDIVKGILAQRSNKQ
jgi:hypothetical protein